MKSVFHDARAVFALFALLALLPSVLAPVNPDAGPPYYGFLCGEAKAVEVLWAAPTETVSGRAITGSLSFNVYKAVAEGPLVKIASMVSGTSFIDTDVKAGGSYAYYVSAVDSLGRESAQSEAAAAQLPPCATGRCDAENKACSTTGTGALCSKAEECDIPTTHSVCSDDKCEIVAGPGPPWQCTSDAQCKGKHAECVNQTCSLVDGTGPAKCLSDNECKPVEYTCDYVTQTCSLSGEGNVLCTPGSSCILPMHSTCSRDACIPVFGTGDDECSSNPPICKKKHMACVNDACELVDGPGPSTCQVDAQCKPADHAICQSEACLSVSGSDDSLCSSNSTCGPGVYSGCVGNACVLVSAPGYPRCQNSEQCRSSETHAVCLDDACVQVAGTGGNKCSSDLECKNKHMECQNNACALVDGKGDSTCFGDEQCVVPKHAICDSGACVQVDGEGVNQCSSNADCTAKHADCIGGACALADGAGPAKCHINLQCNPPETHAVCSPTSPSTCVQAAGPGPDLCGSDNDCIETHTECVNNACKLVSGAGEPKCISDSQCNPVQIGKCDPQGACTTSGNGELCSTATGCLGDTHFICGNKACVVAAGPGEDQCFIDNDCIKKHAACVSGACALAAGPGPPECVVNDDCPVPVCGDGVCNIGEACSADCLSEICDDGVDNNGNGEVDEGCNNVVFKEICGNGVDDDQDGVTDECADLTVTSIYAPDFPAVSGRISVPSNSTVTLEAAVKNLGSDTAKNVGVVLFEGQSGFGSMLSEAFVSLTPGEQKIMRFEVNTSSWFGTVIVSVVADAPKAIEENNEYNNSHEASLDVSDLPDLLAKASTPRTCYALNENISITATITNAGRTVLKQLVDVGLYRGDVVGPPEQAKQLKVGGGN
ncbi:MAG: hypothetical protein HY394_04805 [Candidatus Diapherotrites archaeon]|nr:hypothetical protein [Candidatus Diapherotrites archaeon]